MIGTYVALLYNVPPYVARNLTCREKYFVQDIKYLLHTYLDI
jgi:hypothetical protein